MGLKPKRKGQEGGSTPAKKKPRTQNIPTRGPTQAPPCAEQPPTHSMEEVRVEETGTGTQEIPEEEEPRAGIQYIPEAEEIGPTIVGDTQRPTSTDPSYTQEKRPGEKTSGG
jgi:hypothetical protein